MLFYAVSGIFQPYIGGGYDTLILQLSINFFIRTCMENITFKNHRTEYYYIFDTFMLNNVPY